ncbi:MAG: tryptophan synthase subunit alpha, partial [Bacteroidetes bacterium]
DKNMTDVNSYLQKLKRLNLGNPVLVGFGIKDKTTFEAACTNSNGAIIGTAYIKALAEHGNVTDITRKFLDTIRI